MRWEDERYIKAYTRDTLNWSAMGWEGQATLLLLMRKLDRVGLLEIGPMDPVVAIAAATGLPREIVAVGWARLTAQPEPTLVLRNGTGRAIFMPNFLPAQEANQSDRARQKKSRDVTRAKALLTIRDETSREGGSICDKTSPLASTAQHNLAELDLRAEEDRRGGKPASADPPRSLLVAYLEREFPGIENPTKVEELWREEFQDLDLLAEVRSAQIYATSSGKTYDAPGAFLLGWFKRARKRKQQEADAPPASGSYVLPASDDGAARAEASKAATRKVLAEMQAKPTSSRRNGAA